METNTDSFPYETILGVKKHEGKGAEYLVKYKNKCYRNCEWVSDRIIRGYKDGQSFITRHNRQGIPTEEPFYDPEYEKVERVISFNGNSYLVKWHRLSYDHSTYENSISNADIIKFKSRNTMIMPSENESLTNPIPKLIKKVCNEMGKDTITYNSIMYSLIDLFEMKISDQYNLKSASVVTAVFDDLLSSKQEKGPFLVIADQENIDDWSGLFLQTSESFHSLVLSGSKENRQVIYDKDFKKSPKELTFNVLLTTSDVLSHEIDILSRINWRIVVIDDNSNQYSPKSKLLRDLKDIRTFRKIKIESIRSSNSIQGIQNAINFSISDHGKLFLDSKELSKANELNSIVLPLFQDQQKRGLFETKTVNINCPLSCIQKNYIIKTILDSKNDIIKNSLLCVSHKLLRIFTHPMILDPTIDSDIITTSTKFSVMKELLQRSLKSAERVLIMSQYSLALDLIEDLLSIESIIYCRYDRNKYDNENSEENSVGIDSSVYLLDSKFDINASIPLHIIDKVILLDCSFGTWSAVLRNHRSGRGPASHVSAVYHLDCTSFFESELMVFCSSNGQDTQTTGKIIRNAIIGSLLQGETPSSSEIIDLSVNSRGYKPISDYTKECDEIPDFWETVFSSIEVPIIPKVSHVTNLSHEWKTNERNTLVRWILRLGINRWNDITSLSRLRINPETVFSATRALIRELLRITPSAASFSVARMFIKTESEDSVNIERELIQNSVFGESEFLSQMKTKSAFILKRIEMIFYLNSLFPNINSDINSIPLLKLGGSSPSNSWDDQKDKYLLYVSWKYGFGVYDHFRTDPNSELLKGFNDDIDFNVLNERIIKLCEYAKRLQLSDDKIMDALLTQGFKDEWTHEEMRMVLDYLMRKGIERKEDGSKDYEKMLSSIELQNKTSQQLEDYLAFIMNSCEHPGVGNTLLLSTAQKVTQRVISMDQLRNLMSGLDDRTGPSFIETAPKWRNLPSNWSPNIEYEFLKVINQNGIGSVISIFEQEPFLSMFESGPPTFLLNDHSIIKRIDSLVRFKENGTNSTPKKKANKRADPSVIKPVTISGLADLEDGEIVFPLMITPSSWIINIGTVVYDRPGWHTSRYIYPAGFKSCKLYASVTHPDERVNWISEIVDTGKKNPLFKVYMEDNPKICYQAESPSSPWSCVLKALAKAKNDKSKSLAISGPEAFLLTAPVVTYLIQKLPGADKCREYIFKEIKSGGATQKKAPRAPAQVREKTLRERPSRDRKTKIYSESDSETNVTTLDESESPTDDYE